MSELHKFQERMRAQQVYVYLVNRTNGSIRKLDRDQYLVLTADDLDDSVVRLSEASAKETAAEILSVEAAFVRGAMA